MCASIRRLSDVPAARRICYRTFSRDMVHQMAAKLRRVPSLNLVMLLAVIMLTGRSLVIGDVISWDTIEDQQATIVYTSWGIDVGNLGLGLFYDERLIPYRNA